MTLDLYKKYLANNLSPEEFERLMQYFGEYDNQEELILLIRQELDAAPAIENKALAEQVVARLDRGVPERIKEQIKNGPPQNPLLQNHPLQNRPPLRILRSKRLISRIAVAASIVLAVAIGLLWNYREGQNGRDAETAQAGLSDIEPGKNRAMLELEGWARIELDSSKSGVRANRKGVHYKDGSLVVKLDGRQQSNGSGTMPRYAVLTTPRGGQYQVTLADGTKVWLNAASSLRYPVSFSDDRREVELHGEGYFEVAPDAGRPFIVTSRRQRLTVLGTKFNVNAYVNEPEIVTTLVEGSVKVSDAGSSISRTLHPGQQSIFGREGLAVRQVEVSHYTGWKDGRFIFDRIGLPVILRQIERWYEVDFVFNSPPRDVKLWGTLSRDVMLSKLLQILELNTDYQFKREGRRIIMRQ